MPTCAECRTNHARLTLREKVRRWLFGFFKEEITDLTNDKFALGVGAGFTQGFDVEKRVNSMEDRLTANLRNLEEALRRSLELPTSYDPKAILELTKDGKVFLSGAEVPRETLLEFKEEATKVQQSRVWALLRDKLIAVAVHQGLNTSKNWEEVLAAKLTLDAVKNLDGLLLVLANLKVERDLIIRP